MEDDLNFKGHGRRPQFFGNIEDDFKFLAKWKMMTYIFKQNWMEDDINFFTKWKTTLILKVIEDDHNF